jgi:hypothetical protein
VGELLPRIVDGLYSEAAAAVVTIAYALALWPVHRLQGVLRPPSIIVYLSATLSDTAHYRAAVAAGVRRAGGELRGDPADALTAQLSLGERRSAIASADLFVGLYAWRYGSAGPTAGRSWTEEELNLARRTPQHLWMAPEGAAWPPNKMDQDAMQDASPIRRLRAAVEPVAQPLPASPSTLLDEVYRVVAARQRQLYPVAQLRAELAGFRAFAVSGLVAVIGAGYADARLPGDSMDDLLAVFGVATMAAAVCYLARIATTQLILRA